eukprot:g8669.t1
MVMSPLAEAKARRPRPEAETFLAARPDGIVDVFAAGPGVGLGAEVSDGAIGGSEGTVSGKMSAASSSYESSSVSSEEDEEDILPEALKDAMDEYESELNNGENADEDGEQSADEDNDAENGDDEGEDAKPKRGRLGRKMGLPAAKTPQNQKQHALFAFTTFKKMFTGALAENPHLERIPWTAAALKVLHEAVAYHGISVISQAQRIHNDLAAGHFIPSFLVDFPHRPRHIMDPVPRFRPRKTFTVEADNIFRPPRGTRIGKYHTMPIPKHVLKEAKKLRTKRQKEKLIAKKERKAREAKAREDRQFELMCQIVDGRQAMKEGAEPYSELRCSQQSWSQLDDHGEGSQVLEYSQTVKDELGEQFVDAMQELEDVYSTDSSIEGERRWAKQLPRKDVTRYYETAFAEAGKLGDKAHKKLDAKQVLYEEAAHRNNRKTYSADMQWKRFSRKYKIDRESRLLLPASSFLKHAPEKRTRTAPPQKPEARVGLGLREGVAEGGGSVSVCDASFLHWFADYVDEEERDLGYSLGPAATPAGQEQEPQASEMQEEDDLLRSEKKSCPDGKDTESKTGTGGRRNHGARDETREAAVSEEGRLAAQREGVVPGRQGHQVQDGNRSSRAGDEGHEEKKRTRSGGRRRGGEHDAKRAGEKRNERHQHAQDDIHGHGF